MEASTMFGFERLEVWQEAVSFADLVYGATGHYPEEERYGLTSQMRRAVVSVSSNVAEGSARASRTDFARYIEIATGSLFEVVSQAYISKRRQFLGEREFQALYVAAESQGRMLSGLRRSILDRR